MRRRLLPLLVLLVLAPESLAHPVPKDNHDRSILVRLTPEGVVVDYRLDVDEYRANRDLKDADLSEVKNKRDFHTFFLNYFADWLANNLIARLDGRELDFACIRKQYKFTDQLACDYRFRAPWKLAAGKTYRFTFKENNYTSDSISAVYLSLDHSPQLTLQDVKAPSEELLSLSSAKRTIEDNKLLREASATILVVPSFQPGLARTGLPPEPEPVLPGASRRMRKIVAQSKPVPPYPVGWAKPKPPDEDEESAGHGELLSLLFDTKQGLAVLLLLAAGFRAAHALTPGHGKTLVAAYLVGQRGTVWHALMLGLVTTLTHTGGVIILAVVLAVGFQEVDRGTLQTALALVGGLLIAGLGLWLLLQRLTGRADHIHLGGGHHHEPDPAEVGEQVQATWWQIVFLGIQGGIIPCWDAITMLLLSISAQRLWLGVPLLLAFSAGLAAVLVGLGIAVVSAGHVARASLGNDYRFQKLARLLPILSAVVITVLGLVLTFAAVRTVS